MPPAAPRLFTSPVTLAVIALIWAATWAGMAIGDGGPVTDALPAAATAVTVGGALFMRRLLDLDTSTALAPPWFVPVVVVLAGVAAVAVDAGAAVAALVMASPAAAMVAVPAAFEIGARRGRTAGVRFETLAPLEAATAVDTLVMDKDGTLTTGDLTVVSVDPIEPDHDRNLRWFAGALAKASDHRIDRAVATLSARGRLSDVQVLDGLGLQGSVDRHPVRVGSPAWVGFETAPTIWTTVGVEVDGRALGSITVADDVRPGVAEEVQRLTTLGLRLVLVSDDTPERVQHVARLAGIDAVHVSTSSGAVVTDLLAEGHRVATVGLPATPGASLTIATEKSDAEQAEIVVDDCAPARVADALTIARTTLSRVHRARWTVAILGIAAAVVGATGLVGPIVAAVCAVAVTAVITGLAV